MNHKLRLLSFVEFSCFTILLNILQCRRHISSITNTFMMRALLLISLLTGSTGSPMVGDSTNSVTPAFDPFSNHFPLDVTQTPACIPNDQLSDGIQARSCNEFESNLPDFTTNEKKLTLASSAGDENHFISDLTSHGSPAVSIASSPHLIADATGNGGINLLQLGITGLTAAFATFMICLQALINLSMSSGTAHTDGTSKVAEAPASGTQSGEKLEAASTRLKGLDPCPVETYAHRILALCDVGIQSIQYSELDDMFVLRDPLPCKSAIDLSNARIHYLRLGWFLMLDSNLVVGGCTSLSFVPHWCCDPGTTVPDITVRLYLIRP